MSSSSFVRASSQRFTLSSPVNATANFTAGAWIKFNGLSGGSRYEIFSNEQGSAGFVLYIFETGSGNARARFGVFNGGFPETGDFNTLSPNTWYLLLGVRDNTAGELRLYDAPFGGTIAQDGASDSAGGAPSTSSTNLMVGGQPGSGARYFNGLIFRPFVKFNHVATAGERTALMTMLPGSAISGLDMEITRSGGTLTDVGASGLTVTNSGTTEDADVPIAESGGGGGGANPWYSYAQQRLRLERLWKKRGALWHPSYA